MLFLSCTIPSDPSRIFPSSVNGWTAAEPDGLYDAESLYEYIDGGAEVYRALNVRAVFARRYEREGFPEIIADLFDMGSPSDAFGAYHHDLREGVPAGIGQESEYADGALAFWKGRYFVSILATDETPETRGALIEVGRRVAAAIREEGDPPALLRLLPESGLLPAQVHYFHGHLSLTRYQPVSDRNVLRLGESTEGLLARYRPAASDTPGATTFALLLIAYPSSGKAREALESFTEEYLPEADARGVGRTGGEAWAGARAAGRILVGVLDAPSRADVERSLQEVIDRKASLPEVFDG